MRYLVRMFFFNTFSLWFTSQILPTIILPKGWQPLLLIGLVLTILSTLVAPLIKILLIPINFMTLGFLSWLVHAVILYLLTILMPEVEIVPWTFPGGSYGGFVVPPLYLTFPFALILTSLVIAFFTGLFQKINER
ncbi:hypothetical protein A2875_05245 [Candidatus Gottesmanbacteria bacterium RIFCSPHIGHO2_01_FULL_46_14]|uniref:Uncharacterized protein n=3 Tax=Candidatus Gottesmaniibacteriota TaxID=1752720 RepID=A0A1F5ZNF8_9BACT|nr:MAG: hypothetical protein UY08_C0005G0020 [Candidatus Gottesmanbacteria bacterium GW2011_GWA1_47_8]OGG13885.1 MAG: hypothetical protein A2875_05245 [Candidatus Gottesmanbacteria bacterium RIFCSPHIGHO2_01_FULL_46_14]OGG29290.1 MAG: hypothetical protein A2971_00020 [Candidatus Gottesmanbacteria bacterium RIFCSPLOWO2_01_FULL_46_21]